MNLLLIPARMVVQAWRAAHGGKKTYPSWSGNSAKLRARGAWTSCMQPGEGWVKYYWKPFEELSSRKSVGTIRYC